MVKPQEYDLLYLNIYGAFIFIIYLSKLVFISGLYIYFKYHGGLEENTQENHKKNNKIEQDPFSHKSLLTLNNSGYLSELDSLIKDEIFQSSNLVKNASLKTFKT